MQKNQIKKTFYKILQNFKKNQIQNQEKNKLQKMQKKSKKLFRKIEINQIKQIKNE